MLCVLFACSVPVLGNVERFIFVGLFFFAALACFEAIIVGGWFFRTRACALSEDEARRRRWVDFAFERPLSPPVLHSWPEYFHVNVPLL